MKSLKKNSLKILMLATILAPAFSVKASLQQQKALKLAKGLAAGTVAAGSLYFAVNSLVPNMIRSAFDDGMGGHPYRQFFRGCCGLASLVYGLPKLLEEASTCLPESLTKNINANSKGYVDQLKEFTVELMQECGLMQTENEKVRTIAGVKSARDAGIVLASLYGLQSTWEFNGRDYYTDTFIRSLSDHQLGFSYRMFLLALAHSAYQAAKNSYENGKIAITGKN